jgi:putative transposase
MKYDPNIHHRRSIRLPGYDYSQAGAYFVTICVYQRQCLFGEIIDGQMILNQYGTIVADTYQWLCQRYPYLHTDEWIVMPNHFHVIMVITDKPCRGVSRNAPTINHRHTDHTINQRHTDHTINPHNPPTKRKSLGRLIGAFKTVSTKKINILRDTPGIPLWQRNYYEHIIRNEDGMDKIRQYIINNPLSWEIDQLHPQNLSKW